MSIGKITMFSPLKTNFKAQTKISAPDEFLSEDEKKYFENIGSTIGTDKDIIEISISDLHENKFKPNVLYYTASKNYLIKTDNSVSRVNNKIEIPYVKDGQEIEKNSPYNYIKKALQRLLDKD